MSCLSSSIRNLLLAALFTIATAGVSAQQNGLINVNLSNIDVRVLIADVIDVEENQIPIVVQAPIGIAANVCNIDANVLAEQRRNGDDSCDAEQTSTAFNNLVLRQIGGN